jgi:acetyl-CoA carboxylase biotin carboxyl carrier protein
MAIIDVRAEISGSVWKIEAKVGDSLAEDDAVAILESMKMEIPVTAPEDGKVVEILVSEGDTVADGDIIARIEV